MRSMANIVIPGVPHHLTQLANPWLRTFFEEGDQALYLDVPTEYSANAHAEEAENLIGMGIEQAVAVMRRRDPDTGSHETDES